MAKRRNPKPLTVTARLDQTIARIVKMHAATTGWSLNRVISHMLSICTAALSEDKPALHRLHSRLDAAAAEQHVRTEAAAKIKALRKAEGTP